MRILGVISARGGSKGVVNKNLRTVAGKPLISYIIETALKVRGIDELVVSTDSEEIAGVAEIWGAKVPFMRPSELADDEVPLISVSRHVMEFFDENHYRADAVISIQPTSPLLSVNSIEKAIKLFNGGGYDSVVSITMIKHFHPFRAYKLDGELVRPLSEYTSERFLQKQDRPPAYGFTGGLYLRKRELLEAWDGKGFALGERVGGIVVSEEEAVDIDSELDLLFFETVLCARKKSHIIWEAGENLG